jgi:cytochrome oxidase Cu insertion factor (SCO1/SenC/PrrC family)
MSDSAPTEKTINPWTVWVPIIMIILGVVVLYNYLVLQSLEKNKDRPAYITRLEKDLDGLTERSGKQVRLGELKGKVMVFAHVYTSCPVGCSQIVAEMKDIYDEFAPKHAGLQFVSFAIDPGDNAERLKAYADANDIVKDNWWFVNGDQTKIRTYLTHVVKFFAVKEKPKEQQTSEVDKFEHDMRIALIDHAGHLRGMYDIMNPDPEFRDLAKKRLRKDLGYLLADQEKELAKP